MCVYVLCMQLLRVSSLHPIETRDQTQVFRLGEKCLGLLINPTDLVLLCFA